MKFLAFIFFLFVALFAVVVAIAVRFYFRLRNHARQFRDPFAQQQHQQTTTHDGNIITDQRTEEQKAQKIVPEDEGEYVDYQ